MDNIEVTIRFASGQQGDVVVPSRASWLIRDVKAAVFGQTGIPVAHQRLIGGGRLLQDTAALAELTKPDVPLVLHLAVAPPASPVTATTTAATSSAPSAPVTPARVPIASSSTSSPAPPSVNFASVFQLSPDSLRYRIIIHNGQPYAVPEVSSSSPVTARQPEVTVAAAAAAAPAAQQQDGNDNNNNHHAAAAVGDGAPAPVAAMGAGRPVMDDDEQPNSFVVAIKLLILLWILSPDMATGPFVMMCIVAFGLFLFQTGRLKFVPSVAPAPAAQLPGARAENVPDRPAAIPVPPPAHHAEREHAPVEQAEQAEQAEHFEQPNPHPRRQEDVAPINNMSFVGEVREFFRSFVLSLLPTHQAGQRVV